MGRPERDCVVLGKSYAVDRAIADVPRTYANHDEMGYQAVVEAANSGRLDAQTGL